VQQRQHRLTLTTRGKGFYEFTAEAASWLRSLGAGSGLLTIFIPHTSASLAIQENADPDVVRDLESFFERVAPEDRRLYRHTIEGLDDMPAHIRSVLTQTSLSIPVSGGAMTLGTWQGIYLIEHRARPHRRNVILHFLGEL